MYLPQNTLQALVKKPTFDWPEAVRGN
jgi:hypothetical protein